MDALATIAAACMAVVVVRKLLPGLVERGVRPISCLLCMSLWSTIWWQWLAALYVDEALSMWRVGEWVRWIGATAGRAGWAFIVLWIFHALQSRVGAPDFDGPAPRPEDYSPPPEET